MTRCSLSFDVAQPVWSWPDSRGRVGGELFVGVEPPHPPEPDLDKHQVGHQQPTNAESQGPGARAGRHHAEDEGT